MVVENDGRAYPVNMPKQRARKKEPKLDALDRVVADAIEISDRFSPEPIFGTTGKGSLKSEGVQPLKHLKKEREDR